MNYVVVSHRRDAFSSAGHTHSTVTPQSHRVGVRWVDIWQAVRQSHCDQASLVVGAHALVGLDERGVQDGLLEGKKSSLFLFP